jgi:hypothetical protein
MAAAAGAATGVGFEETPSTPILKQVNKAKKQAETEAIMEALNSTLLEPKTSGADSTRRLQSSSVQNEEAFNRAVD